MHDGKQLYKACHCWLLPCAAIMVWMVCILNGREF